MTTELARAKINLTLRVHGRRPDGFHELDSIVAFADVGDVLTLEAADCFQFVAPGLAVPPDDNLVVKAAHAFFAAFRQRPCRLILDKQLPIAAGIGGGSADAAATLRLLAKTLPPLDDIADQIQRHVRLMQIAEPLGSDVTVCLASQLIHMRGRGHDLTPLLLPVRPLPAVLVNTRDRVPASKTAAVFQALAAGPMPSRVVYTVDDGAARDAAALQSLIVSVGNDLERPARRVLPGVDRALRALSSQDGVLVTRMSGAGPTCFGLFDTSETAAAAAENLRAAHPTWWVVATALS